MMNFPRNTWYIAGWAEELKDGAVITRTILDEPLALYRGEDGAAAALRDLCPHRFAPLSAGKVIGSSLVCGYHGLGFDNTGKCVSNPHGSISSRAVVDSFPLVERHRALWIWMGDPALADNRSIPDFSFLDNTTFRPCQLLSGQADYMLFIENLIDLSHIDFLHTDTLGSSNIMTTRPTQVLEHDERVGLVWDVPDAKVAPLLEMLTNGAAKGKAHQIVTMTWYAPSIVQITSKTTPEGTDDRDAYATNNVSLLTPETESSTHYFFGNTRNYQTENDDLSEMIKDKATAIFKNEDRVMLEKIASRMGSRDFWSLKPVLLPTDRTAVLVRRKIEAMITDEQSRAVEQVTH